jgi:hypothetical protein
MESVSTAKLPLAGSGIAGFLRRLGEITNASEMWRLLPPNSITDISYVTHLGFRSPHLGLASFPAKVTLH